MGELAVVMIVLAAVMAISIGVGLPLYMAMQGAMKDVRERRPA
ncbi:MAG: hypothetical protein U0237_17330 [Thermoleophilia bacterium]